MKFNELPLQPEILQGINKSKYETMTEIQENIIPLSIEGKDVLAKAPTGTGKTAAFVIPALQNLDVNEKRVQILVLAPTRELANQITEEFKNLSMFMRGVNALAIYGGQKIDIQLKLLRNNPQILVSTPGRLLDHIKRGSINLENIKTVILDEADEMLNMGFVVDINKILSTIKQEHQTILLSATISQQIYGVSAKYQKNPVSFETKNAVVSKPNIKQHYIKINERNKAEYIIKLIKTNSWFLTVVFTNTKWKAKELAAKLKDSGITAESLQSDMKQSQRERVMKAFRDGKFHVLVATDVAARGIDVKGIDAVINHDVPKDMEYYVHRIGRTGRNQTEGSSYTLIASDVNFSLSKIEKITNEKLLEIVPSEYDFIEERSKPKGGFGGGNRRGGFGGGQRRGNNNFGRSSNFGGHGARDGRSGGFNHHGHNGGGKFSHSGRNNNNGNSGR